MEYQKIFSAQFIVQWGYVFLAACLTSSGNLCLKQARLAEKSFYSPFFFLALFFYAVNVLAFSRALDQLPLSVVYPTFAGIGFCLVALFSSYFFQETLLLTHWLGMFLILLGVFCLVKSSS